MPNTQTEELVWHKYPEEKPPMVDWFFLQYELALGVSVVDKAHFFYNYFRNSDGEIIDKERVIAWAFIPKGWKDEPEL